MFDYIYKIETLDELFKAANSSSCPECGGVIWENGEFVPGSCLIEDQFMAEAFNEQFNKLSSNITVKRR